MGWSSHNLHDRADIAGDDCVLPIIAEYDRLYNLCNDHDDNTDEDMHEDGIAHNDDIECKNEWRGYDDEFNHTFEVPIVENIDVPFASSGLRTDSVHIPPTTPVTVDYSQRRYTLNTESDSQTVRVSTSRVGSHPSSSANEPSSINDWSVSVNEAIEVGQIYNNKKELQHKLALVAMKENFQFKVTKSCSQRFEVGCRYNDCTW